MIAAVTATNALSQQNIARLVILNHVTEEIRNSPLGRGANNYINTLGKLMMFVKSKNKIRSK